MDYLEKRINKLVAQAHQMEARVAQIKMHLTEHSSPDDYDRESEETATFNSLCESLYINTIIYLDQKKLNYSIEMFINIFGKDPASLNHLSDFEFDHYYSGELFSIFLAKFNAFLSAFSFTESNDSLYDRLVGIRYLETILKNTAVIANKMPVPPTSEAAVYNAVKGTLEAVFTGAKSPRSSFIKSFKEYKPDILIPELHAAVEYKYANSAEKLKSTIDQICADVTGYTGDSDYRIFYAVFYVTQDFWGQEMFARVWSEMNFPKNWKAFYIVGK
ncbi:MULTISPECIES: hypothetical protein [Klebsiella pneumoniae complex]|uniref:hypothetical protein n=1 Tax=Klebsiella TaxID=570 RepID=UPI00058CC996|nr:MULTISPECIES: hypothetical protein [Klebsiella]HBS2773385.1 hypothetical protein [Klebsiella quasipneumoniae subsp. similipneumoniae]HDH1461592.1 hypothetical protein [Klebsiella michiganensis]HDU4532010.1 hypothetical protein [Klebsiella pneumoniae subsp. pneumoniae]ANK24823.1 hypothetical protein WM47_27305 [Klebsiella pneumoniae]MCF2748451.1 hypothetical protein [Klebsiella pneumoniae]